MFSVEDLGAIFPERSARPSPWGSTALSGRGVLEHVGAGCIREPPGPVENPCSRGDRGDITAARHQLLSLGDSPRRLQHHLAADDRLRDGDDDREKGRFNTPYGTIAFTHTRRSVGEILDRTADVGRPLRMAHPRLALEDLRRVGRNLDLVDTEELAAIEEEMGPGGMTRTDFLDLARRAVAAAGYGGLERVVEKEILHYDILHAMARSGLMAGLVFHGGTALRLCQGRAEAERGPGRLHGACPQVACRDRIPSLLSTGFGPDGFVRPANCSAVASSPSGVATRELCRPRPSHHVQCSEFSPRSELVIRETPAALTSRHARSADASGAGSIEAVASSMT